MKKAIESPRAPKPVGAYSQAVEAGGFLYISGQLPVDPGTGKFKGPSIEEQTEQSLRNIEAILEEAGYTMKDVIKCTIYLKDIELFQGMNGVYGSFFEAPYPARAAFAVKALPLGALVEIEAVACR